MAHDNKLQVFFIKKKNVDVDHYMHKYKETNK